MKLAEFRLISLINPLPPMTKNLQFSLDFFVIFISRSIYEIRLKSDSHLNVTHDLSMFESRPDIEWIQQLFRSNCSIRMEGRSF